MSQGKSANYSNETVLGPDGKVLFRGSAKKSDWYLDRNLAELVDKGPPRTIKLLFEPKGKGSRNDEYLLEHKETRCVVCGSKENLTRHHVVPYCYRSNMSSVYKDYNMHDVVLLCEECHIHYEKFATELKKKLADKYNAPLDGLRTATSKVVGYCKTILREKNLPDKRREEMMRKIEEEFGNDDIETIHKCALIGPKAIVTHGEMVVSRMKETEQEFTVLWRKHFIETMRPKFLPKKWDIYREIKDE